MPAAIDVIAVAFGYLSGSVPFAYLLSRRRGIDLRRVGSGNVGASNVLRTSGVRNAVAAMCLDAVKGAVAVFVASRLTSTPAVPLAAGVASVLGHVYPVWLRFRGGKGVATAAGVFAVLSPGALLAACVVFVASVWLTRFISVGSLAATVALAGMTIADDDPLVPVGALASAAIIVHRHRANLVRLFRGTERRVGQRTVGLMSELPH
jgi:acyl phosphate:glycerol-3-phosphate acyltransferase